MGKISEIFNFDDIGTKIKTLTKWVCWITILLLWIGCAMAFLGLLSEGEVGMALIPLLAAAVCPFFVWIGCWAMYAFGQFVDDTHKMRNSTCPDKEEKAVKAQPVATQTTDTPPAKSTVTTCQLCGRDSEQLTYCRIKDDLGIRYRHLCSECMTKHNAAPEN